MSKKIRDRIKRRDDKSRFVAQLADVVVKKKEANENDN